MPQFDISFYPSIIFWLISGFGLCVLFIKNYFLPRFQQFNTQRHQHVESKKQSYQEKVSLSSTLVYEYKKELKEIKDYHCKILEEKIEKLRKEHQDKIQFLEKKLEQDRLVVIEKWETDLKKIEKDILLIVPHHTAAIEKKFKTSLEDISCPL
jgi:F0F1-type ATP synthase membrane subunit b/b'